MKHEFFSRIAAQNIKKNTRLYVPRVLAETGLLGCFFILLTLSMDERLSMALGGSYLPVFMAFGTIIIGLLSFVLILYINSFLMKQRKQEYGMYNILGMEKRHIVRVLFFESLFTSLMSAALGLVFGALFYKVASLLICRLLHREIVAGFYYLSAPTVALSAVIFLALDFFAFLVNALTIRRMKPVELLREKHTGEREPKTKWVLLILGILSLGAGYVIAVTTKSPLEAYLLFFVAVILVIIGTYCLFVTGTTFVLKCLRRNKKYYYSKRHMPAVAGLLFRMKQNAVGLASIAILATGVLVMISTTVSLYSGVEDTMETNYPQHLYLSAYQQSGDTTKHLSFDELSRIVQAAADENGVQIDRIEQEGMLTVAYLLRGDQLLTKAEVGEDDYRMQEITNVIFITQKAYDQLHNERISTTRKSPALQPDEIAVCRINTVSDGSVSTPETLTIGGKTYRVREKLTYFPINTRMDSLVDTFGVVVSDEAVLDGIYRAQKDDYGEFASEYATRIGVTFADEQAASAAGEQLSRSIEQKVEEALPGERTIILDTKWEAEHSVLDMYGTFLFLGILLGFVCLFSTILIIYYKQISEGYEDRARFQIMEKIGMEASEVKKTIGSQLTLQFFLPLVTAGVHTAFAFPILLKLLQVLMLSNTQLFILCTVITFAVFALVYTLVYLLTAKTYYKIVH